MNDCVNAGVRDQLPDLLHERLEPESRAAAMAHVEGCADCRAELELLRGVHAMLAKAAPRVDVGRIVQSLPARRAARSRWMDWRVAAAAALVIIGGTSLTFMTRGGEPVHSDSLVVVAKPEAPSVTPSTDVPNRQSETAGRQPADSQPQPVQQVAGAGETGERGIEMTGGLGDLTDEELRLLLQEIDALEALPLTEPEPAVIPITSKRTVSPTGT